VIGEGFSVCSVHLPIPTHNRPLRGNQMPAQGPREDVQGQNPIDDIHRLANDSARHSQPRTNPTSRLQDCFLLAGDVETETPPGHHGQRIPHAHSHSMFSNAQNFQISGGTMIAGSLFLSTSRDGCRIGNTGGL